MRKFFIAAITTAMLTATAAIAQIPQNYYSSLKGKKGAELKTAVHNIIKNATVLKYGSGSGRTWEGFYTTDRLDDGQVVDRYSNDKRFPARIGRKNCTSKRMQFPCVISFVVFLPIMLPPDV